MNIESLRLFLHLSESLHFAKTSKECHVSPSTLSRIIQRLEEESGKSLFQRNRRSVRLTESGKLFQHFAAQTLQEWQRLNTRFEQEREVLRGKINIFCSVTASYSLLPKLVEPFRKQYPEVSIQLRTGDPNVAIERLLEEKTDLSIAPLPEKLPKKLYSQVIAVTPLRFVIPRNTGKVRKLMNRKKVPWKDVPIIMPESGLIRKHLQHWFRKKNLKPNVYGYVAGHEAILAFVSLGMGIGIVPQLVLENSLIQTQVEEVDIKPGLPDFAVALCTTNEKIDNPVVQAFWKTALNPHISGKS